MTSSSKTKLLVAITRGRDIPEFLEATDKIKGYDKLWVNYYPAYLAYKVIKYFFLDHPEYSHVALLADDLIVKQADIDRLWYTINTLDNNTPVSVAGCCNIDLTNWKDYLNVSYELPQRSPYGRTYNFIKIKDAPTGLLEVGFSGAALMILPREVAPKLSFENDFRYNAGIIASEERGCCQDVIMCNELHDLGVKMFVDFRVKMHHLKQYDGMWYPLSVGVKESSCKLELAKNEIDLLPL